MPDKSLGQHWLRDKATLADIAGSAQLAEHDTVLEIGPGPGTLTSELLRRAGRVVAVEFDHQLAQKLPSQFPGTALTVTSGDILSYDLSQLPADYKVVANVPYYITNKIVKKLMTAANKPSIAVLLVQREVAERLAAHPGQLSILALSAQSYCDVSLGSVVGRDLFTPSPKVDSQVVILTRRDKPFITSRDEKAFFQLIKIGFSSPRKKLVSNLANGLSLPKQRIIEVMQAATLTENARPQEVSIEQWLYIMRELPNNIR